MKGKVVEGYKISVIVPVYNTEKYVRRCVETLTEQTYKNLEILLVDDGSRDESGRICDELAKEDGRIQVIHKENGGLVSAWNRGFVQSTGQYVSFVDSDDWVDLNMLEEMSTAATGNPREIIASDYVIEKESGSRRYVWQALPPGEYDRAAIEREVIPNLLGRENRYVTMSRCMKLIGRELIAENRKYSDVKAVFGEDVTVMLPSLIDCHRLVILDHRAYYHYLYVDSSMVHIYDERLYEKIKLLREIVARIVKDKFGGEELKQRQLQADREHIFMLLLVLKNEARGNPAGYRKNILSLCREAEVRRLCRDIDIEIKEKANKLLYLTLRHPNEVTVRLLRFAMLLYYRK